jgi:hypothetical protein
MPTIFELKDQAVTDTPLLLFECVLQGGAVERWSTHRATVDSATYEPRVLQHNIFEIQTASDQGVDGIPRVSILLGNADSHFSEIERATGWKGARLTVRFVFYDLRHDTAATAAAVVFQGTCNPPDEIREATFRITAANRMNLQRLLLPQVRIERRCPWEFPATEGQRTEAIDGGANGKYSRYYRCGYSAGITGGTGNLNGGVPYTDCSFTRADCQARGMFVNFGGIEFVPPAIAVRTHGDKDFHTSALQSNAARYNDFVPLAYGTAWYSAPVVFARNDGNLTRMEVLLGMGEIQGVLKVLVNDVEIPAGISGQNMTGTGWYNLITAGARSGAVDPDFPEGDPYGSMAYLGVVVPNRLNDGTSLARVKVLLQGLKLPAYAADGAPAGEVFTANPAWVVLDILRRTGWSESEINLASFAAAADFCAESVDGVDIYGAAVTLPRFECNAALVSRKSAADLLRGVRNTARLLLTYDAAGNLELRVENAISLQQPNQPEWSNSTENLADGWPSYEFGDGSNGISGLLRKPDGEPSIRIYSRSLADTPNRFAVEFQDSLNEYQQDSFSLVDPDDVTRAGQEVTATFNAIGIANFNQAARLLKWSLDKSIRGNTYIEFDTSVKAFGVRPGDIITVTYLKEGFLRQPFRILKIAPGVNHRITRITAQIHDDSWYADGNGQLGSGSASGRQPGAGMGVPRPLIGTELDDNGDIQFGVEESAATGSDGAAERGLAVSFFSPAIAGGTGPGIPLLSLVPQVSSGGSLVDGQTLYYAMAATDSSENESALSFIVRAIIASPSSKVTLSGLSFAPGTTAFRVYRGATPAQLFRIATDQAPAGEFIDTGLAKELAAPPDPNFDHANFYWRMELQPEFAASIHSANTIGNSTLEMAVNRYRGAIARITRGPGAGQERAISANTATTLTLASPWNILPTASSFFVVAENGWRFGALTNSSPVQFAVPDRGGETVHISGRAANVNDVEAAAELSIVTRWQLEGDGSFDDDVPPAPFFGLSAARQNGTVELSGVSFTGLENTHTIAAGTLSLHYRNELLGTPAIHLAATISDADIEIDLNAAGTAVAGTLLQIEAEVLRVEDVLLSGTRYAVTRNIDGTGAAPHDALNPVYTLADLTVIAPFPRDFFGSPYAGSWTYPIPLPDARVACAELFVTNSRGSSAQHGIFLTHNDDLGLRTFSGGQYSLQVAGFLSVDASAVPPVVVEASHAVHEVYAVLGAAADAEVKVRVLVNGAPYCLVKFIAGTTLSDGVDGNVLPPLLVGDLITLSVESVGIADAGADLTVLIRL